MAQTQYHNFKRALQSYPENWRFLGILVAGVYSGFDNIVTVNGNNLTIGHSLTGVGKVDDTAIAAVGPCAVLMSRQGVIVEETDNQTFAVDYNSGNANNRIDIVVMQHQYVPTQGGSPATFFVVKGSTNGQEPAVPNTFKQIKVGRFVIPANAANHTNTIWERAETTSLGGRFPLYKSNLRDVPVISANSLVNDFNAQINTGVYMMPNSPANSPGGSNRWVLFVMTYVSWTAQIAFDPITGKAYSRGAQSSVWSSWRNLNNSDINVEVQDLTAVIGTRDYTEENYIADDESLTNSLDALDIALKVVADAISSIQADVSSHTSAIGTRTYEENNYVADSESLTASVNKLDKALKDKVTPPNFANVTLQGAFSNSTTPYLGYRKLEIGNFLQLRGYINWTTAPNSGDVVGNLPSDHRPAHEVSRPVTGSSPGSEYQYTYLIRTSGNIELWENGKTSGVALSQANTSLYFDDIISLD